MDPSQVRWKSRRNGVCDWVSSKTWALNLDGLNLQPGATESLLAVDKKSWKKEIEDIKEYFSIFGDRLPVALSDRAESIKNMLGSV